MSFTMAAGKPSSGASIIIVVNLLQIAWRGRYISFVEIHLPVATNKLARGVFISTPASL
jgi:hypothetical protein